jgi:hypothetical protein
MRMVLFLLRVVVRLGDQIDGLNHLSEWHTGFQVDCTHSASVGCFEQAHSSALREHEHRSHVTNGSPAFGGAPGRIAQRSLGSAELVAGEPRHIAVNQVDRHVRSM